MKARESGEQREQEKREKVGTAKCKREEREAKVLLNDPKDPKNVAQRLEIRKFDYTRPALHLLKKGALKWLPGSKVARFFQSRFHHENGPLTV